MPSTASVAELRADNPILFEYRNGMFYLSDPSLGFLRAMPAESFLRSFEGAAKAITSYLASVDTPQAGGDVVPFRRKRAHAALVQGSTCSKTAS